MTFDEALNKLAMLSEFVGVSSNYRDDFVVKAQDIILELRDTYAPTIEMTQLQVAQMMSFKEIGAGFSTFMYKQGLGQVPAFEDWIKTKREDELMQAWLHPETIKVVN